MSSLAMETTHGSKIRAGRIFSSFFFEVDYPKIHPNMDYSFLRNALPPKSTSRKEEQKKMIDHFENFLSKNSPLNKKPLAAPSPPDNAHMCKESQNPTSSKELQERNQTTLLSTNESHHRRMIGIIMKTLFRLNRLSVLSFFFFIFWFLLKK